MSEEIWNAFVAAHEAKLNATSALVGDPESFAAISGSSPERSPEPFGSLSDVDDEVDRALAALHSATATPLSHPDHPATQLAKESGKDIHQIVTDTDEQVHQEIGKLAESNSRDDAAWAAMMDKKEKESGDKLLAANHAFFQKIKERGLAHPDERPFLMRIAEGFSAVVAAVVNFVKKAAEWLVQKLEWIWNKIKDGAAWIWDKIKTAANAVAHFFGL
ncbi:hypothetical protein B1813_01395 [Saccharomonospora piscinae]|uniref:Uncharacterized protein n=1 Tax=Saccharomonospora piscinae TaxID=687388 RepID=A0A1V9ACB9_SACPI|nr:hypothetical protein [Saccharomonospora piscinae]OQO94775.1 hypothetical protein B1813_01395 [Saccharomonospora piscinae]